jgi:hypothetical protein
VAAFHLSDPEDKTVRVLSLSMDVVEGTPMGGGRL